MQKFTFEPLAEQHRNAVTDIFNHYIANSFAAYPEQPVSPEFYNRFLELVKHYPAVAVMAGTEVAGFALLRPYNPFPVFRETAELSYFIKPEFTGKGAGKAALGLLTERGKAMGIKTLLAEISARNEQSLAFHARNGFKECGRFPTVGKKFGKPFDVVWMYKPIC